MTPSRASLVPFAALGYGLASARARRLGCAIDRHGALMRDGVVTRVQNAVRFSKIQSVSMTQTPFDRRHGMATLRVDTAGASDMELSFSVPYLPLRTARMLMNRMVREASALAFRW